MITRLDFVPQARQGIIEIVTPTDPSVVIVTVDGIQGLFELDNNGIIEPGRILVPIGGSPAACAINLAAAINKHWGDRVRAVADNNIVDVVALTPDVLLSFGFVGPGGTAGLTQNEQRMLPTGFVMVRHQVNSIDVARGKVVVYVRLDYIEQVMVEFLAPSAGPQTGGWHLDWTGHVVTSPGKIELVNAGGAPFSEAHWMQLLAIGDRYEQ